MAAHAPGEHPARLALDSAGHGGRIAAAVSAIALLFSGYSLWDSSVRSAELKAYVPPVIQYSSPYNNSNFEVIAVPVTLVNDGGRTGTVLSMSLEATSAKTKQAKRFYAADFGRWTMERAQAGAFEPFAPISLAGKSSRTETVLFYTASPAEKPDQLISEPGVYGFKLTIEQAAATGLASSNAPVETDFDAELRSYDARAFLKGTLPLFSTTSRSVASGAASK